MAKIKVHELAKELGADKGEIVAYLRAKGYAAMTGVTAVPEGEVENVRSRFGGGKSRAAAREKADVKTGRKGRRPLKKARELSACSALTMRPLRCRRKPGGRIS